MIKNIISFIAIITISTSAFSQVKDYDETALLFSQEKLNGTARFLSMSGAFGALGGDLSAAGINPAGMAIYKYNTASFSLDANSKRNNDTYYNLSSSDRINDFGFAQAGGLIVFENGNDNWSKFTFSVNTAVSNDFDDLISLSGNTNISNESFFLNPDPLADLYDNVASQKMSNYTIGNKYKTNFTVATKFNKSTYFGVSVISNSIDYAQEMTVTESSEDLNGNTFDASLNQRLDVYGQGVAFNLGLIVIPVQKLRLGLSYQTATWYSLTEEFSENTSVDLSNANVTQPENINSAFEYRLSAPGKATASIAYIFGKEGLISLDYSYKDYGKAKLSPSNEFETGFNYNEQIKNNYEAVSSINVGGEYRLKYVSLRAGYHFENSPYKNVTENIKGYSLGFGFKTGEYSNLDFAFNQTSYQDRNRYLSTPNYVSSNDLNNKFTISYVVNF